MAGSARIIASIVCHHAVAGAVAAFAVVWRPAIAAIDPPAPQSFRCRAGQARPRAGRDRQLQRLPYRARRPRTLPAACRCRRRSAPSIPPTSRRMPRPGSAAGRRPRSARHALRRRPRRPAPLSDLSLRSLHQCLRRGRPGALCLPDDAAAGSRAGARKPACRFRSTSGS